MHDPMFAYDEEMTDLIFDYCRWRLALDPVPLDYGGYSAPFDDALADLIGPTGRDPQEVLTRFDRLASAVISCDSPRFLSFIPAAPTKASLLFDMVVSCSSLQGTSWLESAGAVSAENQALDVLRGLVGLPVGAGGCFVSGGSAGNLSALMVARDTAPARSGGRRPKVACTDEAHSSVIKALAVLALEPFIVPAVDHRLTGPALAGALGADRDSAADVVAVVATAGTTNAGLVDDLAGVAEVARAHRLWFHVDAAYGGGSLFSPRVATLFAGIEQVDSVIVDPHKWLFAPYDSAALLYRHPALAKAVHTQDAAYLDAIHTESVVPTESPPPGAAGAPVTGPWNPSDYAYHLSRRTRGLPLWFSMAVYGTEAYRHAVEAVLDTAGRCADLIEATPHTELVRRPDLSIVLLRRIGWSRADYEAWSARLVAEQIAFVTPTTWETGPVARLALLHPDTTVDIVAEVLATMA